MRNLALLPCLLLLGAAPPAPTPDQRLKAIVQPVSGATMKRHGREAGQLRHPAHACRRRPIPKRGIGAALTGAKRSSQFSRACFGCLTVTRASDVVTGQAHPDADPRHAT